MNPLPITPQILSIAPRIIWFEPPEQALANPIRFLAYAMTYARHEDMRVIRQYVSGDDFREALDRAPPGIIDARSWAYWNLMMGRYPAPPLPKRRFEEANSPHNSTSSVGENTKQNLSCDLKTLAKTGAKPGSKCERNNRAKTLKPSGVARSRIGWIKISRKKSNR